MLLIIVILNHISLPFVSLLTLFWVLNLPWSANQTSSIFSISRIQYIPSVSLSFSQWYLSSPARNSFPQHCNYIHFGSTKQLLNCQGKHSKTSCNHGYGFVRYMKHFRQLSFNNCTWGNALLLFFYFSLWFVFYLSFTLLLRNFQIGLLFRLWQPHVPFVLIFSLHHAVEKYYNRYSGMSKFLQLQNIFWHTAPRVAPVQIKVATVAKMTNKIRPKKENSQTPFGKQNVAPHQWENGKNPRLHAIVSCQFPPHPPLSPFPPFCDHNSFCNTS